MTPGVALAPDVAGLVLSPGPGDPARLDGPVALAQAAIADGRPLLGICLGHQIVGRAAGARDAQAALRPPRRQPPVRDLDTGRVQVTAQNHEVGSSPTRCRPAAGSASASATSTTARSRACATRAADRDRPVPPRGLPRTARRAGGLRPLPDGCRPRMTSAAGHAGQRADPRLRAGHHRPGGRVRLRRHAGLPRAARRGRPHDPPQLATRRRS